MSERQDSSISDVHESVLAPPQILTSPPTDLPVDPERPTRLNSLTLEPNRFKSIIRKESEIRRQKSVSFQNQPTVIDVDSFKQYNKPIYATESGCCYKNCEIF